MSSEDKDPLKSMDWKSIQEPVSSDSGDAVAAKKRIRRRIRQIPDYYFLPRRSLSATLLIYGACIAGGIGAGMLTEIWINKKVKGRFGSIFFNRFIGGVLTEDGGVIWEFDK